MHETHSMNVEAPTEFSHVFSQFERAAKKHKLQQPLWSDVKRPAVFEDGLQKLRTELQRKPEFGDFWLPWYEGILRGDPLESKLTQRIAVEVTGNDWNACLLYTSPSPRDQRGSRMPSSA